MKINNIRMKNLELTQSLQNWIDEKIGGLDKFAEFTEIFVDVERETKHHRKGDVYCAKTEIFLPGKKIMAEARGDDILNVIVELKDRLQQEIKKYKAKKGAY